MRNSFLLNLIFLILINVLIKPAYIFAVEIPVQNLTGHDAYGMYFAFLNLAYIFQIFSDLGVQNLISGELPKDRSRFKVMLSNTVVLRLICALLFLFGFGIAGYFLGYWQLDAKLFSIVAVNVLLISFIQYIRANAAGLGLYYSQSFLSVIDKAVLLILMLIYIYGLNDMTLSILNFAVAQTISLILACLIGLLLLRNHLGFVKPIRAEMIKLLKQAIPYGIIIVLMFLYTRVDAIMIEQMLSDGLRQAGLYASAYRLYDVVTMITLLFSSLLLPMFSELENHTAGRQRLFYGSLHLIVAVAVLVAMPGIALRDLIMNSLYDITTLGSINTMGILFLAFIFKSTIFITSTLLTSSRRFSSMIILFVIGIALNMLINFLLIPDFGISGAAYATLATQVLVATGCGVICHRQGLIEFQWNEYLRIGCTCFLFAVVFVLVIQAEFDISAWLQAICITILLGVVYILTHFKMIAQLSREISRSKEGA